MDNTRKRRPSSNTSEKTPKKRRVSLRPITDFHRDSFAALAPLINTFDPGVKDSWEGVIHTIPKEYWSLNRRAKRGEKNLTYNGYPWNRSFIGRNIFKVNHVRDHIQTSAKYYFTGGKDGMTLFMLDHDEHEPWQKELACPAWNILAKYWRMHFGSEPYHRDSCGGYHAYPILSYPLNYLDKDSSYQAVNQAYQRLQHVVGLLLLCHGNYSTFEVKGTITTKTKSGSLAALPLCTFISRLRDSWNYADLQRFKEQRIITLSELNAFIEYLADVVAEQPQLLDRHRSIKDAIKEQHRKRDQSPQENTSAVPVQENTSALSSLKNSSVESLPTQVVEKVPTVSQTEPMPNHPPVETKVSAKLCSLDLDAENPDSRQREHRVLMAAARQLGRVPSISEALDLLDRPDDYWNEKRQKRVMGTLRFISKSFDASKCKRGGIKLGLNLDKYTETFAHRYWGRKIEPAKLSAFVAALEWSLDHQDRGDGSVPRSRIAKLSWLSNEMCKNLARFVVRERIFECDLSDYRQNQARRWHICKQFPRREWWRKKNNTSLRSIPLRCIELRRGKFLVAPLRLAPMNSPLAGFSSGEVAKRNDTTHTYYHNSLVSKRTIFSPLPHLSRGYSGRGPPQKEGRMRNWM
jgi:hypothetical protein